MNNLESSNEIADKRNLNSKIEIDPREFMDKAIARSGESSEASDRQGQIEISDVFAQRNSDSGRKAAVQFCGDNLITDGSSWNLKDANGKILADENSLPGNLNDGSKLETRSYNDLPKAFTLTAPNQDQIIIQKSTQEDQSFLAVRLKRTEAADHLEALKLPSADTLILQGDHWSLENAGGTELSNDQIVNKSSPFMALKLDNGAKIVRTLPVGDRQVFKISYPNGDEAVIGETISNSGKIGTDYNSAAVTWKSK